MTKQSKQTRAVAEEQAKEGPQEAPGASQGPQSAPEPGPYRPKPTGKAWKPLTLQDAMQGESVWYLITQRDQFAAAALTGLLAGAGLLLASPDGWEKNIVARQAYEFADAMVAQRKVQPK